MEHHLLPNQAHFRVRQGWWPNMLLVPQVTDDPLQKQTLVLPDGSQIVLTLQYITSQIGWFIQSITYKNFTLQGLRITNSPNILRQFKNQIPFGLACYTANNREPTQQQDFLSGNSNLYVLTHAEVTQWEEFLANSGNV